ncbi:hypothetical protein [Williamsia sp. CHRR-6]|uniref:hypothetical protein n=1 Tax=Williamsia sp. CHRR-6 TaxID=2835871 RepID=UPI001BDA1093|nr:hypothetical protein [Williamsia sp. CHRR-6]MBT0568501.1 hypothetical protein [Williamsia sp. CHRR-6]
MDTSPQHDFWGPTPLFRRADLDETGRREMRRIHRDVYFDPTAETTPTDLIKAATLRAGPGAVVAGTSAAILHGTRYVNQTDVELMRNAQGQARNRNAVRIIRSDQLDPVDIVTIDGMAVTSPVRTAYDLGRRFPDWQALARLDELTAVTDLDLRSLWAYIRDHPRTRGICQIRELIKWIDPLAESPQESHLRYAIIKDQYPQPESQVELIERGRIIARFDLGYRRYKLGIEYDGYDYHSSPQQQAADAARDRDAARLGWKTIRVLGPELRDEPFAVTARIGRALTERGWRRGSTA